MCSERLSRLEDNIDLVLRGLVLFGAEASAGNVEVQGEHGFDRQMPRGVSEVSVTSGGLDIADVCCPGYEVHWVRRAL